MGEVCTAPAGYPVKATGSTQGRVKDERKQLYDTCHKPPSATGYALGTLRLLPGPTITNGHRAVDGPIPPLAVGELVGDFVPHFDGSGGSVRILGSVFFYVYYFPGAVLTLQVAFFDGLDFFRILGFDRA